MGFWLPDEPQLWDVDWDNFWKLVPAPASSGRANQSGLKGKKEQERESNSRSLGETAESTDVSLASSFFFIMITFDVNQLVQNLFALML